jgi:hypothetical protein
MSEYFYYIEPQGLPRYWANESHGPLHEAVQLYLHQQYVTPLLKAYLVYVVDAPFWRRNPHITEQDLRQIEALGKSFAAATTAAEVAELIESCRELGIDPL